LVDSRYHEKRERVLAAVTFGPLDRLPVQGNNGTIAALQAATGRNDYVSRAKEVFTQAMKIWDVDLVLQFVQPDRQDRTLGPNAEVATRDGLLSVVYGMLRDWLEGHGPCRSPEDFRDFCLSLPPAGQASSYVDAEATAARWLELDRWGEFLRPIVFVPGHLCGSVPWMWYSQVGYESYLMAHLLYPEAVERLFAFCGEEARLKNAAIGSVVRGHGLMPLVYAGEDICDNDGPLVSPATLRQLYFPHLARAVEPLRQAGVHWMWHSDGDILPILPDLLACGIDGFQGFEEDKGMDLARLASTPLPDGGLPFLCGSVSVTTAFYRPPEEVAADVARMVALAKARGGGVILSASSSMMENMPLESVLAFYRSGREARLT